MKDGEYWKERFKQMEEAQNDTSIRKAQEIQEQFDRSLAAIDGKINAWYQRLVNNNGVSMQEARKMLDKGELKEFQWNVEDYIKYAEENEISGAWEKQLENASARVHISRLEALKIETQQEMEKLYGNCIDSIDKHIQSVYTNDFYHTAFEIQKGVGVGTNIQKLNADYTKKIISKPWSVDEKNFSDRLWESKTKLINNVHNSLSRMCITGEPPDRAIKEIAKEMNVSKAQASRVVMTESAAFANKARQDCMTDLGVKEFEVVETLDSHTCETCGDMDGKHYPMKDYQTGVTAPPFHPNCRGCTCPYFKDEFTVGEERAARGADGKTYYVPSDMTYEDWKKAFVDGKSDVGLKEVVSDDTIQIKEGRKLSLSDIDDFEKWSNDYFKANENIEMSTANFPNINEYTGGSYSAINAVERFEKGTEEYNKWDRAYHGIEKYKKISDNISKEISAFRNTEPLQVYRMVGNVDYITGKTSSLEDMASCIGKTFTEKGFTSTTVCSDTTLPFGGSKETKTKLEIYVPKETRGAYVYKISDSPAEFEYLIDKNTTFKIVDAGTREIQAKNYKGEVKTIQERFMKLEVVKQ